MSEASATLNTTNPGPRGSEPERNGIMNSGERRLPWWHMILTGVIAFVVVAVLLLATGAFTLPAILVLGFFAHLVIGYLYSRVREGERWAKDRLMTLILVGAFATAMIPLVSLLWEVISKGGPRLLTPGFLTGDMQGFNGGADGGGILHAIVGTLIITLGASIISIPIGLLTAVFLVEYAQTGWRKTLGKGITFLVDVMTGVPSIVAGLFTLALFTTLSGEAGLRMGAMGSVALSVLMIPTVVRSSEEMIRLVPLELREAAYALGVPKWLTIVRVVLRTAIAGLTTGVTLAIARVIGETAPLMFTIGVFQMMNANPFEGRMMALPTFINQQYGFGHAVCGDKGEKVLNYFTREEFACNPDINYQRAWAAALTLIVIVMVLNIFARFVSYYFSPKTGR
ncbi:phosphate ABC transporter [Mycobacteroides abscessus subsp. abscessus]|nr:phosphate ABC transporter [Mycobacteroides abscessus subsp. abscessus]